MTSRLLKAATAAFIVSFAMGGCTSTAHTSAVTPLAISAATGGLPDPVPSDLPVGAKVLLQREGSGTTTLDLTTLVGAAKSVNVRWTCVGDGGVKITDGAAKTTVGGGCVTTVAGATDLGGAIPLSIVSSLHWTLQADSATHWRIAVTTDS